LQTNFFRLSFFLNLVALADALGEIEASVPESVRDEEEEIVEEQKDDGKLGFCEIQ
jgi:anionic cell wall polymer biosynthesis LytR-Cps2A-Psr (LCP) family protein